MRRLLALYVYDGRVGDCERARQGYQEYHLDPHTHTQTHTAEGLHTCSQACLLAPLRPPQRCLHSGNQAILRAGKHCRHTKVIAPDRLVCFRFPSKAALHVRLICSPSTADLFAKYGCYCSACGQADADGATSLADHAVH